MTIGERQVKSRIPAAILTFVIGSVLTVSACSSSTTTSTHTPSPSPSKSTPKHGGFQAGPDPCRLVTPPDILSTLNEHMAKVSGSASTCSYANASTTDRVSVTTAKTTVSGAEQMVSGTARTVKVKIQHVSGLGNTAVAYLTTTKTLSIATCLAAKNGIFIFINVSSPHASHILQAAIALAKKAASRT